MTDEEIFARIREISKRYSEDDWPLYDLQCIFDAVDKRSGIKR